MKALILSAGLGKRLRPPTDIIPKPLADINGKPIIDIIVEKLKNIGVDEFAFNLHHLPEKIREHFSSSAEKNIFSYEEELLDTGGTLASFSDWLSEDEFLIVHNGDIVVGMDGEFHINTWSGDDSYLVQRTCSFRPKDEYKKGYNYEEQKVEK